MFNLLFSLLFICSYNYCYSQIGKIDSTFGTNGNTINFPWVDQFIVQSDDKILIAGGAGNNFGLARFKSNGKVDSTFGNNGKATGTTDPDASEGCNGIALQQDGKIVVSSSGTDNQHFILARYTSDGHLDQSFGTNGIVKTIWGNWIQYPKLSVQSDGKIIAGGQGYISGQTRDFVLIRYNSNGSLDNTFGAFGKVNTSFSRPIATLTSLVVLSDGKILTAGFTDSTGILHEKYAVAKYNSDGSLDNSFGTGGKLEPFLSNYYQDGTLSSVIVQLDGRIVLAGGYYDPNLAFVGYACLIRLNSNGTFDNSFGNNGLLLENFDTAFFGPSNSFLGIVMQTDNKLIAVGQLHYNFNDSTNWAISRYKSNGVIDTTFGLNGRIVFYLAGGWPNSVSLQSSGKILVNDLVMHRFLNDTFLGAFDLYESNNTILIYPNPIQTQVTLKYMLKQDEQISIELFDVLGKLVQQFITNETRTAGKHEEVLKLNELLTSGTYIINISNGKNSQGVKVVKE